MFRRVLPLALFALAAAGCPNKQPDYPGQGKGMGGGSSVWLFAYDPVEVRQILNRIKKQNGLIAVRYTATPDGEQHMEVLQGCEVPGTYQYSMAPMAVRSLVMKSQSELKAQLPLSYAAFSASMKESSYVEIDYQSPGDFNAQFDQVALGDGCDGATHIVEHISVGAYTTKIGGASSAQVGAKGPAGVGEGEAGSSASNDQKTSAGYFNACGSTSDKQMAGAPLDCSYPLSITLRPLAAMHANTASCQDSSLISMNNMGFAFTGQVFTIERAQIAAVEGDNADGEFACKAELSGGEKKALAKITGFLQANSSVKAHVSVWCTPLLPLSPAHPEQHEQMVRGVFASAGLQGRVTFDHCSPLPFTALGSNGVYVELTSGCKEFSAAPPLKCSKK